MMMVYFVQKRDVSEAREVGIRDEDLSFSGLTENLM